jgi:hypothetical protein
MLRKAIELVRRAGLRAYHGSDEPDIEELAAHKPGYQYGGDIGSGVYVSENYETAAIYGKFVYTLDLDLDQREIFDLSSENQHLVEGYEGHSVLVGESIPPFYFFVGKDKYLVSNTDEDIGASLRAKEMLIESLEEAGLDMLVPAVQEADGLLDIDDIDWILNDLAESEEAQAAIVATVAPMVAAAEAWLEANKATVVALDEIGDIVEAAGYKALYFERAGTAGDEILVFDPANVRIVEQVTKMAKLRVNAQAEAYDTPTFDIPVSMRDPDFDPKFLDYAKKLLDRLTAVADHLGTEDRKSLLQALTNATSEFSAFPEAFLYFMNDILAPSGDVELLFQLLDKMEDNLSGIDPTWTGAWDPQNMLDYAIAALSKLLGSPTPVLKSPWGQDRKAKLRIVAFKDYMEMLDTAAEFLNGEYTPVGTESAPGVSWMVIYSGPYAGKSFMVWDGSLYDESIAARAKKLNMVYFAPTSLGISIMEVPDIGTDTTDEQMALWDKHWPGWDRHQKSE